RQQAYLTKGVKVEIVDTRESGAPFYYGFYFDGGLLSFIKYLGRAEKPLQETPFYVDKNSENVEVEPAFVFNNEYEMQELSFANNIYTPDGGMHLTGFRSALTRTLNDYARANEYIKGTEENLTGDDVREGLIVVLSVKLREPQFEGQTKARLGSPEARTATETVVGEALKEFLDRNNGDARRIIEKCLLAARARKAAKAAKETVLRKGVLEGLTLPGKLADCSSKNPAESELFIVEGDSAGGCFFGETKIALTDGRSLSFKELVEEDKKGAKNYCYTVDVNGRIAIGEVRNPRVTKKNAAVVKVILDNGEEIVCTPDHKFMLADGVYKEARDLAPTDSLMPLYRQYSRIGQRIAIEGYEMVFDPSARRWLFTHALADQYNLARGVYTEAAGSHRHHKDFNKRNNNPDNLLRLTREGHLATHREHAAVTLQRPETLEKLRALRATPEFKQKMSVVMSAMRDVLSVRAKKQWEDAEYKAFMAQKFLAFYRGNSAYRAQNNAQLAAGQKKYWSEEAHREAQAERTRGYFVAHPEERTARIIAAKEQWQDAALRQWRKEKTKTQWTVEFRAKRRAAYNETYYHKALRVLRSIFERVGTIDSGAYELERKTTNDKSLLRYDTILARFFGNDAARLHETVAHYNHKVSSVTPLTETMDVYDMEVPGTHNFALASGVFVHNSAKQGRDRKFQAILPLKGKILNVEKSNVDKMLSSKEVKALVIALGTAIAESFDIARLRYHKIILMTDADVDGAHIRTLLMTLFYRYFRAIVEQGHLYIAQPPLYRLQKGKEVWYAYSDAEKEKIIKQLGGDKGEKINIQRYKGLGEMNPDQLWETTIDPSKRMLKVIEIEDAAAADRMFDVLMGEEVAQRKNFIQTHALSVKNLDV
ncbi:MAG: intein-containing DNA gyrase subunit B, partial [Candidatus Harrisonbacteria bacterium]|nr:intein-containing DNA gyrase subunit B [Candidatus Harrisonbacteria bacterium]